MLPRFNLTEKQEEFNRVIDVEKQRWKMRKLMILQSSVSPPLQQLPPKLHSGSSLLGNPILTPAHKRAFFSQVSASFQWPCRLQRRNFKPPRLSFRIFGRKMRKFSVSAAMRLDDFSDDLLIEKDFSTVERPLIYISAFSCGSISWLASAQVAFASEGVGTNAVYEISELFELGIQLTYLLLLLALLGVGSFFVIRQVLVRRELDLSAKELQEQVRSGDASATELFELGAVMLRRKFYPAATKYLLQAIEKWDGDDQDLAQVYNALGVSYVLDGKVEKGISQFENAVKLQPGYVTAWNNLGDAYEKKKNYKSALKAFEEVMLFDPNNKVARPRRNALKEKVKVYKGVPVKSKKS